MDGYNAVSYTHLDVYKRQGNRYVKHFTCWSQLLAMMFGQLSNRESLRDLIVALEAHQGKRYHLGSVSYTHLERTAYWGVNIMRQ